MITSEQLNYHSLEFFKQYKNKENRQNNFESDALEYVKKKSDFKYKDSLSADTLVMILEDLNYLEYIKDTKRFHIITKKGLEYLNNN